MTRRVARAGAPHVRDDAIYVVGAGAQTPVGRSVLAAAAAVRCGISAYAEHPFMLDRYNEAMVVARAPWLDEALSGEARVAALAADAAREALGGLGPGGVGERLRVHFALSVDTLPGGAARARVADAVAEAVGDVTGAAMRAEAAVVLQGHAGGLLALERAVGQLRRGQATCCLVVGADSWLDVDVLDAVDGAGRLHSVNQSWGFTPGEGAGSCVVATGAHVLRAGLKPLVELVGVATGREPHVLGSAGVCVGEGLTAAFRGVLDPERAVARSYCDLNGEVYRAEEYGFAIGRLGECFEDASRFTAAAESWGDVGAASGLLALTLPLAAWSRGYADGAASLVWSSSTTAPLRAAAVLHDVNDMSAGEV